MTLAYAKADYQDFLQQKIIVAKALKELYATVWFEPHIRVISRDPQIAVRQFKSLIDQLLNDINRSRGIQSTYIQKLVSYDAMFVIMKSIGYGKFIDKTISDDILWQTIGDEVKKTIQ